MTATDGSGWRRPLVAAMLISAAAGVAWGVCALPRQERAGLRACLALALAGAVAAQASAAGRRRREAARLDEVVSRAPGAPLLFTDAEGRVAAASRAACDWFGGPAGLSGRPWFSLFACEGELEKFVGQVRLRDEAGLRQPRSAAARAQTAGGAGRAVVVTCVPLGLPRRGCLLHLSSAARCEAAEKSLDELRRRQDELLARIGALFTPGVSGRGLTGATLGVTAPEDERATGDFAECLLWGDQVCDWVLGDAVGEGLSAALLCVEVRVGLLRVALDLAGRGEGEMRAPAPEAVVDALRRSIVRRLAAREAFLTLCYARFDFTSRTLAWVDCGHAPILHWQAAARTAVALKGENTPLGLVAEESSVVRRASFGTGDVFVLGSDALIGVRRAGGEVFGVARLAEAVERLSGARVRDLGQALRQRVLDFAARGGGAAERLSIICLRVHKPKSAVCARRWTFDCPAQLSGLSRFRRHVQSVYQDGAVAARVQPSAQDLMLLALHEVLVNIIEGASREAGQSAPTIRLETCLFEDRMEWTFSHGSAFFSPTHVHLPARDGSQSRGYGLYIIREVADSVHYYQSEKGESCVRLIKWFQREQGGEEA